MTWLRIVKEINIRVTFSSGQTTTPSSEGPPSAPTGLIFREVTADSVTLEWHLADDVAYYIIKYRRPDSGDVFSDVAYGNEWTIVGLEPDTEYDFEVLGVNQFGSSAPSNTASVVTLGIPG